MRPLKHPGVDKSQAHNSQLRKSSDWELAVWRLGVDPASEHRLARLDDRIGDATAGRDSVDTGERCQPPRVFRHGVIDAIVPRLEMKSRLSYYLDYLMEGREQFAALG